MRILTKESVSMKEACYRLYVDIHGVEMSEDRRKIENVRHMVEKCRPIFSLRISHNELTVAVYSYRIDLLLFSVLKNYRKL